MKVKAQWEKRILELGGRDYKADAQDKFGDIPMDGSIYQYYGAAKLYQLKDDEPELQPKTELFGVKLTSRLDAKYYGLGEDEEESYLLGLESEA